MKRSVAIVALSGLLVIASACGSSGSTLPGLGPAPTDRAAAPDAPASAGAPDDTNADLSNISIPGGVPGLSGDCATLYQSFASAMGNIGSSAPDSMQNVADAFASLESKVPSELEDDVQTLADAYGQMAEVMKQYGGDYAKMAADPAAAAKLTFLDSDTVTAANQAISNYFDQTCGTSS